MKPLEWKAVETMSNYSCPPIVTYECQIGTSYDGTEKWFCRCKYKYDKNAFMLCFDNDKEWEESGDFDGHKVATSRPFMRTNVVYAEDYWSEHEKTYHTKFCQYDQICQTIFNFVRSMHLKPFDE